MANMTRKEALGVLHQVYRAYVDEAFSADLMGRAIQALFVLTDAIHGPREEGDSYVLCDGCHLRRARHEIGSRNYCDACRPQATAIPVAQPCSAALEVKGPMQSRARRHKL